MKKESDAMLYVSLISLSDWKKTLPDSKMTNQHFLMRKVSSKTKEHKLQKKPNNG
jgi:hypothetical protein